MDDHTGSGDYLVYIGEKILVVRQVESDRAAIEAALEFLSSVQPYKWFRDEPHIARKLGPDDKVIWL